MKENEIQISDWLYSIIDRIDHTEKKLCKVTGIRTDSNVPLIQCDDTDVWYPLDSYEPIPLTPEILEKNGFEDIGDDTYQLEEKPYWFWVDFFNHQYGCEYDTSTYEYEDDEHRLKLYGIPSVHELQHALRLCEIEKEIIL